ncbi:hypothetical protein FRC17_000420 [Serendipita sp. 399]|nr:hypothetical protein FRC17_000420 [Serendipita sp. 399]
MSEAHRDARRRVSFLIAAKSMKRKAIGLFARLMASIPVIRAADDAKTGTGIVYITEDQPTTLHGINTKFTQQLAPKKQVMLSKALNFATAEVVEVISDTEARLKKEFGGESGKGTAKILDALREQDIKGLDYKVLPFVDQAEMYSAVYEKLKQGGCIGIFPEGGSHDRTDFLPFKAGVSIMALGAMAANPGLQVQIVPVGLSYFHPHRFRSRAVVEFGKAIAVPEELVEQFKTGGTAKREASGKLLDIIFDALKTVTVRAPDYDTLMVIQAARRLYKAPGQHLSLGQVVELNKRFIAGYLHFKDEPRVRQLRENVTKYNRLLRDLGLRDHQVIQAKRAYWKSLGLLIYRVLLLVVWSIFALPGVILNGPIFLLATMLSRQKAKEALAASTVKVAGKDVLATWKVLVSLGAAPILYSFYAVLATVVAVKAGAPMKWRIWTPFLTIAGLPIVGYFALKFGEAGMDVLKSLRPLVISLIPMQDKQLDKLKEMRRELQKEVSETIEEFGPKLYEDFDEWRMLPPTSSVPASGETLGLYRRKVHTGTIDGQGSLLVHPMTWLDERLFGWSRSAKRGTSAWGGGGISGATSRVGSPDVSDDEDHGDYDNVLGYLPSIVGDAMNGLGLTRSKTPRSLRGSFADLPSVRRAEEERARSSKRSQPPSPLLSVKKLPVHSRNSSYGSVGVTFEEPRPPRNGSPPSPTLSTRSGGARRRKMSLTDSVPVQRIGEVDREETFEVATEELNKEIEEKRRSRGLED